MIVAWGPDGKLEIRINLKRQFAKGMHKSRRRSDLKSPNRIVMPIQTNCARKIGHTTLCLRGQGVCHFL
jgi:hypothetical protein